MASSASSEKKFLLLKNVVVSSELRELKGSPTFMTESLTKWKKFCVESQMILLETIAKILNNRDVAYHCGN